MCQDIVKHHFWLNIYQPVSFYISIPLTTLGLFEIINKIYSVLRQSTIIANWCTKICVTLTVTWIIQPRGS